MEDIAFGNGFHSAIIVANPAAVSNMKNVSDVVPFAGFLAIMVDDRKQFVLLLLLLIFVFRRHDFCGKISER